MYVNKEEVLTCIKLSLITVGKTNLLFRKEGLFILSKNFFVLYWLWKVHELS